MLIYHLLAVFVGCNHIFAPTDCAIGKLNSGEDAFTIINEMMVQFTISLIFFA